MGVPLEIQVVDKDFQVKGTIGDPKFATVIHRWKDPSSATVSIRANHPRLDRLLEPGSRMRIFDADEKHVISGRCKNFRGSGPKNAFVEIDVVDDKVLLQQVLGWVVPTAGIMAQGTAGTNWEMTGPAETVLKRAVLLNAVNRLGLPLTIAPDLGRGAEVTAKLRFQSLWERLMPVTDGAGIGELLGVTVKHVGNGLVLDVFEPRTYNKPIDVTSGIVKDWSWTRTAAQATRAVAGGQGDGVLRLFREKANAELETLLNWKMESFRDARDTADPALMYTRIDEVLAEGAEKVGLALTLSQTANFQYGKNFSIGDMVTVNIGTGQMVERLEEATLSWTREGGFISRPRFGEKNDDPNAQTLGLIRKIARSLMIPKTER